MHILYSTGGKMKERTNKILSIVFIVIMILSSFSLSYAASIFDSFSSAQQSDSQAEDISLVVNDVVLSGSTEKLKATFSWEAVDDIDVTYAVRVWTGDANYRSSSAKMIVDTTNSDSDSPITDTTFSYEGFLNGTTYYYQVGFTKDGSRFTYSDVKQFGVNYNIVEMKAGPSVSFKNPNNKTFGERTQYDNYVVVKFTKPDTNVYDKYFLYRGSKKIANITSYSKSYTNKNVPGGTYTYSIRAYYTGTNIYAEFFSPSITVHSTITAAVKSNITWSAVTKAEAKLYKNSTDSGYYSTIPKGTKLSTTGKQYPTEMEFVYSEPKRIQVKYNGKTGWVKWSQIKTKYGINNSNDYSVSKKEAFVNGKDISSSSSYMIWVSRYTQRVNVFKGKNGSWKLLKVYNTNTGKFQRQTKGGFFKIKSHTPKVYRISEDGRPYYFEYSSAFGGSGTFHNITRWVANDQRSASIKRVPITGGCVRLFDDAAKFIYDTVPLQSKVYIH